VAREGLAGKVPVVGVYCIKAAVRGVHKGEFACTITSDNFGRDEWAFRSAMRALMKKFEPTKETPEHRAGSMVKAARSGHQGNVEDYIKRKENMRPSKPRRNEPVGRVVGPIRRV